MSQSNADPGVVFVDRFRGQNALVTGAASGLGRAVAARLAREGAVVWIADRDLDGARSVADELCSEGLAASAVPIDVTSQDSVLAAFAQAAVAKGGVDIAVHAAGIVGPNDRPIDELSFEEFRAVIDVNLHGSFLVLKHCLPYMRKRNYGRVLLFASIAGKEGNPKMSAYSASKAGVIGLVKSAGKELAGPDSNITVNGIAPCTVLTPMVEGMDPAAVAYMKSKIPMGRLATIDEVVGISCFAVSREASGTTGFVYDLSLGRAVY